MKRFFLLGLVFLGLSTSQAIGQQYDFRYKSDVKVVIGTDTLKNAWAGGYNTPQFSKIHLNNDTQEDLFIFDRNTNKVSTFLAVNNAGTWRWKYAPEYETIFPDDLDAWVLLRDLDNDGRKDIFTRTSLGIKVYKNVAPATAGDPPVFQVYRSLLYYGNNFNLKLGTADLPTIDDIDGDGDLDIMAFEWSSGNSIEFYRNTGGANLTFTLANSTWGNVFRCPAICKSFTFGANTCRVSQPMHIGGSSLLVIDLDGDGDKDMLIGQEDCPEMLKFINTGTTASPVFTGYQINFPNATNAVNFNSYPAAFYEDVTFDGVKDLIAAPNVFNNVHSDVNMTKSAWLYQNSGTNASPVFSFVRKDFLQNEMVELGEGSAPAFTDIDADGDLDMLVGNYADVQNFTGYRASIRYYKNVGNVTNPIFKLETNDYLSLSARNFQGIKPQFTDINGDNAPDLIFASIFGNGEINYILNTAAAGQPVAFSAANIQIFPHGYSRNDIPAFYDLDGDGDKDLLIATNEVLSGDPSRINVYENTGTTTNPVWVFRFNNAGGIVPQPAWGPDAFITITDLNQDNNPDLLVGDNSGQISLYENFLYRLKLTLTPQKRIFFRPLANGLHESYLAPNMALAAADLTGDGQPELVVGGLNGGLKYYELVSVGPAIPVSQPQPLGVNEQLAAHSIAVFPNPANSLVTITSDERVKVEICDLIGKKVLQNTVFEKEHQIEVADLKPGIYLVRLQTSDNRTAVRKLVIQ